jgi:glyceraldehyde 3-phosphate dehydrogenase
MKQISVAINGFGRIGRAFLRLVFESPEAREAIKIVGINCGPVPAERIDLLFKHDTTYRPFALEVEQKGSSLFINSTEIPLFFITEPEKLPWKQLNADWIVEASGHYTSKQGAMQHLAAGAQSVLITAPSKDADITIIPGVNDELYNPKQHQIISLGSCTTNCFAPIIKVLHESFTLIEGLMTTVHAYTCDQNLLDNSHKDPRRARAAALNIIPTKTGADTVITQIFPELAGKIKGIALRVPVAQVSLLDFTFSTEKKCTRDEINTAFKTYAQKQNHMPLTYTEEPLVSSDFAGHHASVIIDTELTQATSSMAKVFGWYDNEIGYSAKIKDFLLHKAKNIR